MDPAGRWQSLPKGPSLKHLTDPSYGIPREQQKPALQELTRAHVESFNYAVREGLSHAVQAIPPFEFAFKDERISLTIVDAVISPPMVPKGNICKELNIYPAECRGRRSTYRGKLTADISWAVNGISKGVIKQFLGYVPIMVKSKLCNLYNLPPKALIEHHEEAEEMGGYFIINGIEKVIRMLIMPRRNFPIAMVRPKWKTRGPGYTQYGVSMHCVREEHSAVNMNLHYLENGTVMLNFIYRKELFFLPLGFALKALVNFSDYQIFQELIKGKEEDSFFRNSISQMLRIVTEEGCSTQKQVLNYLGECFRVKLSLPDWYPNEQAAEFLFNQCICIHLKSSTEKFYMLCLMTRKLFALAKGECMEENPDSLVNQEVLTPGQLFLMFLKEKMEAWLVSIKIALDKRAQKANVSINTENLMKIFNMGTDLTKPFEYLLATGNLRSKTGLGFLQDSGLCVVADKLNFIRYLSHFRCVHRGADFAKMRTTTVRRLLPESWGFLCPVHTPDGEPCGLMNHLTAVCEVVTQLVYTASIPALLCSLGVTPVDGAPHRPYSECYPVLLDGVMVGWVDKDLAPGVADSLRHFKVLREKRIPPWMEVALIPMTGKPSLYPGLFLFTTPCRLVRPVQNLELGKEELIGTMEQIFMNIAIFEDEVLAGVTTHQELFPHSLLSVIANFIPFSDHNQSPRNMYQCQMGKQTMGFPLLTYQARSDNKLYRLQTPQSPLVRPYMYDYYDMDNYPIGTNAIVAVISYTGYDMEDAMIVNKASWERGFAHGSVYKSEFIDLSEKIKQGDDSLVFGVKPGDPRVLQKLDDDGLPFIGAQLQYGDPYYGYLNLNTGENFVIYYKSKENCIVDNIKVCSNDTGSGKFKCICITMRVPRNPTIGDKFASRHGQKGILSRLWPAEDMPFSESGMVPDILFNPHGFPSRMTIGMLIESMAGKSAALHGLCHDATPFTFSEENSALEYFGEMLKAAGYNFYGTERLYSGISGIELEADIFIGVVYYQRLRHMVSDKFQVRTTGARDKVTNQPIGGRNVQGGIRFGEMERDALLAHGTSFLLHDRLFNCSDRSVAHVCVECGSLLSPLLEKPPPSWSAMRNRKYNCTLCNRSDTIDTVSVPYVFRYFVAELAAMNIKVKLDVI
ncbi:DNA-directed RNA polymerase I subunit RPA2 [Prionailurus viverrinus]|uniref:DNA-directed RNA polymerase I subunit RPA2 n=1 Tax=Prionailurus bengalensis TaxID=37029 RepID=UPI001CA807BB|nr:DNA-directed RNA polymerase I subunit RPA2 [Prionailurus bengalensis]XP_043459916.1 DNA-directed RNA polymerase I subunit RPA2 [Prionailurus bengalensis]XP_047709576.1 DNA-directed RNA polymerase I subunit RPA2 [Prionailurus viverrinus]